MERLDIKSAPDRANIEASIHFARYSVATPLVKNKRVLDIACGEGYGSYLLKQAGAKEVIGVDIFADAVSRATRSFGGPGIEFITADAITIEDRFAPEYFDVIVSCETIEHIEDPVAYLQSLKRVAKKDAIIIISCPNDYWYFPEEHERNPYHLRKYRFEEFQQLTTDVLGDNVNWSIGTAIFGFGSTSLDIKQDYEAVSDSWMKFSPVQGAYLVSGGEVPEFNAKNCSYYLGIWNVPEVTNGAAIFPVTMDAYARMTQAMDGTLPTNEKSELDALRHRLTVLQDASTYKSDLRKARLNYQATLAENELIKERLYVFNAEVTRLSAECDRMRVGYDRYLRLGGLVPLPVRALLKKIYRVVHRERS